MARGLAHLNRREENDDIPTRPGHFDYGVGRTFRRARSQRQGPIGSARQGNPPLSRRGPGIGKLELDRAIGRRARQSDHPKCGPSRTDVLPGRQGQSRRHGDDCRARRRVSKPDDVLRRRGHRQAIQ